MLQESRHPSFAADVVEGEDMTEEQQFEFGLARLIEGFERFASTSDTAK